MEEKNVVKLWDNSSSSSNAPLRRPNTSNIERPQQTQESMSSGQGNAQNTQNVDISILSKTTLSVDAKEWLPANYNKNGTAAPISSVQNRLQRIRLNTEDVQESSQAHGDQNNPLQSSNCDPTIDTTKLKEIVFALTYDPGQFDRVVGTFLDILQPYSEDIDVCNRVADMLFDSVSIFYVI